jgi:hypothetical protein
MNPTQQSGVEQSQSSEASLRTEWQSVRWSQPSRVITCEQGIGVVHRTIGHCGGGSPWYVQPANVWAPRQAGQ